MGERSLYNIKDTILEDCVFKYGESPLKEVSNLVLNNVVFEYKYPLWYANHISVNNSRFEELSRSGIWYTKDISIKNSLILAPKLFRRCEGVNVFNCELPNSLEMCWNSRDVNFYDCKVKGDYFCLNLVGGHFNNLQLDGNYAFDGAKNLVIENSTLNSKDSLWNCENVIVKNSHIVGEYLAWNSKNVIFIDCTLESNQGLCYIDGLQMINCKLMNTDLAFEFSSGIDAEISSNIVSVKNPLSGRIKAEKIEKLILDKKYVDLDKIEVEDE